MSVEAGVLIAKDGSPLYWHLPADRSAGALPDSQDLWEVIWENRRNLLGFAHSHPGSGLPGPSMEDITTFIAIESALARRLVWWITSSDQLVHVNWIGPEKFSYLVTPSIEEPAWLAELRKQSYYEHRMVRRWTATVPPSDMVIAADGDSEILRKLDELANQGESE